MAMTIDDRHNSSVRETQESILFGLLAQGHSLVQTNYRMGPDLVLTDPGTGAATILEAKAGASSVVSAIFGACAVLQLESHAQLNWYIKSVREKASTMTARDVLLGFRGSSCQFLAVDQEPSPRTYATVSMVSDSVSKEYEVLMKFDQRARRIIEHHGLRVISARIRDWSSIEDSDWKEVVLDYSVEADSGKALALWDRLSDELARDTEGRLPEQSLMSVNVQWK